MRRAVAAGVAVGTVAVGLLGLAEATQTRPDRIRPGTTTELVVRVRTKGLDPAMAAAGLVAACRPTAGPAALTGPMEVVGDRFVVEARPALGPHAARRLLGCLEDATIDNASADVVHRRDRDDEGAQLEP